MRARIPWVAITIAVGFLASACGIGPPSVPVANSAEPANSVAAPTDTPRAATPPPTPIPTGTPVALIDHATRSTDVVLRFDDGYGDYGICELCGGWSSFTPGPEFTLFGDGTVLFRFERAEPLPVEGPIMRGRPFRIGHLDEQQVQALLGFALGEGGLGSARERYDTRTDTDDPGYSTYTIRVGGVDKVVEIVGSPDPFEAMTEHLVGLDRDNGIPTQVWAPDHYWGLLIEASSWMEVGVMAEPDRADVAAWPWPRITPWVSSTATHPVQENRHRVMSATEAAVLGLSDNGGVVQRIYLIGPDAKTIYSFSLWPMFPNERS